jgi:hypothetical protein
MGSDPRTARTEVYRLVGRSGKTGGLRNRTIAETYPYTDESGQVIFEVVRFEPKGFQQRRPGGGDRWIWSVRGVRQVPYRLDRIVNAERVFVVEGEKDVHTLEEWGYTATTNAGGAGKWTPTHANYLKGKEVVVIPDSRAE